MKSEFGHYHLIRLETLLKNMGFENVVLDDDGESSFWLDITLGEKEAVIECTDNGYHVQVIDENGENIASKDALKLDDVPEYLESVAS